MHINLCSEYFQNNVPFFFFPFTPHPFFPAAKCRMKIQRPFLIHSLYETINKIISTVVCTDQDAQNCIIAFSTISKGERKATNYKTLLVLSSPQKIKHL